MRTDGELPAASGWPDDYVWPESDPDAKSVAADSEVIQIPPDNGRREIHRIAARVVFLQAQRDFMTWDNLDVGHTVGLLAIVRDHAEQFLEPNMFAIFREAYQKLDGAIVDYEQKEFYKLNLREVRDLLNEIMAAFEDLEGILNMKIGKRARRRHH